LLPTLTASSYGSCQGGSAGRDGQPNRPSLQTMATRGLLPTLTVCGNYNKAGLSAKSGDGLATALAKLPTLAARDYRHPNAKSYAERGGGSKGGQLPNAVGGPLNPTWCEWFMGFPIGWTELRPLGTPKSRSAPPRHSACSLPSLEPEPC
jgi:hypothetical protein